MKPYFSLPINTKYLVPSKTPSIKHQSNLCIKCYKLKDFHMIFRLLKYYQN